MTSTKHDRGIGERFDARAGASHSSHVTVKALLRPILTLVGQYPKGRYLTFWELTGERKKQGCEVSLVSGEMLSHLKLVPAYLIRVFA
jgi:hypothetical protein